MPALTPDEVRIWGRARVEKEMRERLDDVQAIRLRAGGSLSGLTSQETIDKVKQHNQDLNHLGERLDNIKALDDAEQESAKRLTELDTPEGKMVHSKGKGGEKARVDSRDAGTIFATSDAYKSFREDGQKGIEMEVPIGSLLPEYRMIDVKGFKHPMTKATIGTDSSLIDVDTQFPPESLRVGVLVDELFQQPNIADLMPQATIDQNAVPFMRETVNAQGAVETAEGALAPEASLSFAEDSAPVRKIPVMLPATEEILEDEQLVRGHINARLPLFIRLREDSQLLNGNGIGQNLQGILGLSGIDTSTTYTIAGSTGQAQLEAVFSAGMRVAENFLMPDAVVTSLGLWETIRLAKDGNNNYLIAPATEGATPRVWGWRVVTNENMPPELATNEPILVGAFAQASQIWRRRAITLAVSDSHEDNFGRGILVVKATTRLAVTHYRAAGYATVTSS